MNNVIRASIAFLGVVALAGCATTATNSVKAASVPGMGVSGPAVTNIPQLEVADNGTRLNLSSGSTAQATIYDIVAPLKETERRYIAQAIFFVADYENCLSNGKIRVHSNVRNQDRFNNLSPEGCYNNRRQIHKMAGLTRQSYGKLGRPDPNKIVRYNTLATGPVNQGWGPSESWNRYATRTSTAANGLTRTEIQAKYHTIMGSNAEQVTSDLIEGALDVLSNPLGSILDTVTPGS